MIFSRIRRMRLPERVARKLLAAAMASVLAMTSSEGQLSARSAGRSPGVHSTCGGEGGEGESLQRVRPLPPGERRSRWAGRRGEEQAAPHGSWARVAFLAVVGGEWLPTPASQASGRTCPMPRYRLPLPMTFWLTDTLAWCRTAAPVVPPPAAAAMCAAGDADPTLDATADAAGPGPPAMCAAAGGSGRLGTAGCWGCGRLPAAAGRGTAAGSVTSGDRISAFSTSLQAPW